MRRAITALTIMLLVLQAVPAGAEVTRDELDRAQQEIRDLSTALEREAARFESAYQRELELQDELDRLVAVLSVRERELAEARLGARDRILQMYMAGLGESPVAGVFDAGSFDDLPALFGYAETVVDADRVAVNRLRAVRASFLAERDRLEVALAAQEQVRIELDDIAGGILEDLAAADAEYRALKLEWDAQEAARIAREEEERRRAAELFAATSTTTTTTTTTTTIPETTTTVAEDTTTTTVAEDTTTTTVAEDTTTTTAPPPPPSSGGRVCPVDGPHTFTDTWGAPRGGGRTHEGVDMMAARGTPIVAVEDGSIGRLSNGSLSGFAIWLYGDSGDHFFHAHLDAYADGLREGDRVSAGQLIGYVGSTGNASYAYPHLHWEYHPGGGSAVNPTPLAEELCR